MLETHDLQKLGFIHDKARQLSNDLSEIENCKIDALAIKLRVEIRQHLAASRKKMRDLKGYLLRKQKNERQTTVKSRYLLS